MSYEDQVWLVVLSVMGALFALAILAALIGVTWGIAEDEYARECIGAWFGRRKGEFHVVVNVLGFFAIVAVEWFYVTARDLWERSVPDYSKED